MKFLSYIYPQVIVQKESKYNGTIRVVESMGRVYIDVGGLMQSGTFLIRTWSLAFKKLHLPKQKVSSILLLGLGGGSFVTVSKKYFPTAKIVAVDIDPVIVQVGKEYMGLKESSELKIIIGDAENEVQKLVVQKKHFDLIFVDLYTGYNLPPFVESDRFLKNLTTLRSKNAAVIFNRLFFQKHKNEARKFLDKLTQMFEDVSTAQVYANLIIKI